MNRPLLMLAAHIVAGSKLPELEIEPTEVDAGGAPTRYIIRDAARSVLARLQFQNGTLAEVGQNGLTNEALLAIVADRLDAFQSGPFPCAENADALDCVRKALSCLVRRTQRRIAEKTEGLHVEVPAAVPEPVPAEPVASEPVPEPALENDGGKAVDPTV